ncbi:hypothetical protein [Streptococcus anginosus]|uniref:hypothetical protein n=1 Tax=Streptococcus anginosus TaxID=1328 RepID=UPI0022DF5B43|nr:hypothetical protein [Streptococcus anginosus]
MKHDIDIKITKNSEEKINEFDAKEYLEKYVKSDETNQEEKDNENTMPKISGCTISVMSVIVGVNLISDILPIFEGSFKFCNINVFARNFKISTQTNVLAVLLVVFLIINNLFKKKK